MLIKRFLEWYGNLLDMEKRLLWFQKSLGKIKSIPSVSLSDDKTLTVIRSRSYVVILSKRS